MLFFNSKLLNIHVGKVPENLPKLQSIRCYGNLARFPADFMFQVDTEEAQSLRLQFATLDVTDKGSKDGKPGRGRHSKYLPMAFTEHGAIMAATLLNSARATEISVHVVRAFVEWRSMLANNRELSNKLHSRPIGFITRDDKAKLKASKVARKT